MINVRIEFNDTLDAATLLVIFKARYICIYIYIYMVNDMLFRAARVLKIVSLTSRDKEEDN